MFFKKFIGKSRGNTNNEFNILSHRATRNSATQNNKEKTEFYDMINRLGCQIEIDDKTGKVKTNMGKSNLSQFSTDELVSFQRVANSYFRALLEQHPIDIDECVVPMAVRGILQIEIDDRDAAQHIDAIDRLKEELKVMEGFVRTIGSDIEKTGRLPSEEMLETFDNFQDNFQEECKRLKNIKITGDISFKVKSEAMKLLARSKSYGTYLGKIRLEKLKGFDQYKNKEVRRTISTKPSGQSL